MSEVTLDKWKQTRHEDRVAREISLMWVERDVDRAWDAATTAEREACANVCSTRAEQWARLQRDRSDDRYEIRGIEAASCAAAIKEADDDHI